MVEALTLFCAFASAFERQRSAAASGVAIAMQPGFSFRREACFSVPTSAS